MTPAQRNIMKTVTSITHAQDAEARRGIIARKFKRLYNQAHKDNQRNGLATNPRKWLKKPRAKDLVLPF